MVFWIAACAGMTKGCVGWLKHYWCYFIVVMIFSIVVVAPAVYSSEAP